MHFDNLSFASNLISLRKQLHMTQRELAQKINVTPQMISKYEKALAVPDLPNLVCLADALNTTPNELLDSTRITREHRYFIAIHGRAPTSTEFILFNERGEILNHVFLSNGNPADIGCSRACALLFSGIDSCLAVQPNVSGICIGLPGIYKNDENCIQITGALSKRYPHMWISADNDLENVVRASEIRKGVVLSFGGGSNLAAIDGSFRDMLSGFGHYFRCDGSKYDIGCEVLQRALYCGEGLLAPTPLTTTVLQVLDRDLAVSENGIPTGSEILTSVHQANRIHWIHQKNTAFITSFAPYVIRAYLNGDTEAAEILQKCLEITIRRINFARDKYDLPGQVAAFCENPEEQIILSDFLEPGIGFRIRFLDVPPIYGAVLETLRHFRRTLPDFTYDAKLVKTAFLHDYHT